MKWGKLFHLLLFALLISLYNSQEIYCEDDEAAEPKEVEDCEKRKVKDGDYRCCFIESEIKIAGETIKSKSCGSVSKDDYDKIEDLIDEYKEHPEDGVEIEEYSVDCASEYTMISLALLILIFLWKN